MVCFNLHEVVKSSQDHRDKNQNGDYHRLGEVGNGELLFNEYRVSVWEDEKVLEMDSGDPAQQYE